MQVHPGWRHVLTALVLTCLVACGGGGNGGTDGGNGGDPNNVQVTQKLEMPDGSPVANTEVVYQSTNGVLKLYTGEAGGPPALRANASTTPGGIYTIAVPPGRYDVTADGLGPVVVWIPASAAGGPLNLAPVTVVPHDPTPLNVTGTWRGHFSATDSRGEVTNGTLTANLTQTNGTISGTWQEGVDTGDISGSINGNAFQCTLTTHDPSADCAPFDLRLKGSVDTSTTPPRLIGALCGTPCQFDPSLPVTIVQGTFTFPKQ